MDLTSQFSWTPGSVLHGTGVASDQYKDEWKYSNMVDVSDFESITFTHIQTTSTGSVLGYVFYDEEGNRVSGATNGGTSFAPVTKTINVPENAKYFRCMWINTTHSSYNASIHEIETKFYCYGNAEQAQN